MLLLVVTLDAVRFHLPDLLTGEHRARDLHAAGIALALAVEVVVLWRAGRSLARQVVLRHRLRGLPVQERRVIDGHRIDIVPSAKAVAFCAGLVRPRICVSAAALERLGTQELRAVLAHEAAHVRRRDPLRSAVAQVVADGFAFVAPVRRLAARQAATADLAADAAAVRAAAGSRAPLAAAFLALEDPAPDRVDHLLGRPLPAASRTVLVTTAVATTALGAVALELVLAAEDPALPLLLLPAAAVPSVLGFLASR